MAGSPETESQNAVKLLSEHWRAWSEAARDRAPAGYEAMTEELRALQDDVAASVPDSEAITEVTILLARARRMLVPHRAAESEQIFGRLLNLPTRGQTMSPPLWIDSYRDAEMTGATQFGRFHVGNNGVVHGGAISLLFDDALGRVADIASGGRSRTAFLKVDYRSVTPYDRRLQVRVSLTEQSGRKRYLHGTLSDGDRLCAEATGLFVEMRPEQP